MTAKTPFPLLKALLDDPKSLMTFQGLDTSLSKARQESMLVLEDLLSAHDLSDEEGAEWVLSRAKSKMIGFEDKADHVDYPIIAMFCKSNYQRMPLTCLMLMSHGHTNAWTDPRVSQEITPLYLDILAVLPASPAKVHSMVEFCWSEYDLEAWKNAECPHVLTLLGMTNDCIRACGDVKDQRLSKAKRDLLQQLAKYTEKNFKSLVKILVDRMSAYRIKNEGATTGGKDFQPLVDQQINALFRFICDMAHSETVLSRSEVGYFSELNDLFKEVMRNLNGKKQFTGDAYDPVHVASLMLTRFANDHQALASWFCNRAPEIPEKEQGIIGSIVMALGDHIRPYCENSELKAKGFTGMMFVLSTWLARCDQSIPVNSSLKEQTLGAFFEPELLDDVIKELDAPGLKFLSSYVLDHHPSLRRKIPRAERGHHLSDALGL
jgi:predicted Zn-ribbon and HTH transcriptional regulator